MYPTWSAIICVNIKVFGKVFQIINCNTQWCFTVIQLTLAFQLTLLCPACCCFSIHQLLFLPATVGGPPAPCDGLLLLWWWMHKVFQNNFLFYLAESVSLFDGWTLLPVAWKSPSFVHWLWQRLCKYIPKGRVDVFAASWVDFCAIWLMKYSMMH